MPYPLHSSDRPRGRVRPHRITSLSRFVAGALCVLPLLGCSSEEPIQRYKIPKPALLYAENHVEKADAGATRSAGAVDQLLGAVLPHGTQTWYFKMTGPQAIVAKQETAFRQLIASIRFADAGARPQWTLPDDWRENPGVGPRLATLTVDVDGQTLEVSVIQLETSPSPTSLLDNVNRWRQQMQLPAITEKDLPRETVTVDLPDGTATLVSLLGRYSGGDTASSTLGSGSVPTASTPDTLDP